MSKIERQLLIMSIVIASAMYLGASAISRNVENEDLAIQLEAIVDRIEKTHVLVDSENNQPPSLSRILASCEFSGRGDLDPSLRRLADVCDVIYYITWNKTATVDAQAQYACERAMHCLWMTTNPIDYFKACMDSYMQRPILAGAAMRVLARQGDKGIRDAATTYESAWDSDTARREHVQGSDISAGSRESCLVCDVSDEISKLGDDGAITRLIALATDCSGWLFRSADTKQRIWDRGGQVRLSETTDQSGSRPFGIEMEQAVVYWARRSLLERSRKQPDAVAKAVVEFQFSKSWPSRGDGDPSIDVTDIFSSEVTGILVDHWLDSGCVATWKALKGLK